MIRCRGFVDRFSHSSRSNATNQYKQISGIKMKGHITSYVEEKQYGFIKGENGKDYFFHKNDVVDQNEILDGLNVIFDPIPTRKGLAAKSVQLGLANIPIYLDPDRFVFTSESSINGHEILFITTYSIEDKDPNIAKLALRERALLYGLNGVVGVHLEKRTAMSGNYRYTVHRFTGGLCLIKKIAYTMDQDEARQNALEVQDELQKIRPRIFAIHEQEKFFLLRWLSDFWTYLKITISMKMTALEAAIRSWMNR